MPMDSRKRDLPHRIVVTGSAVHMGRQLMNAELQSYQVYSMATPFATDLIEKSCESISGAQREVGKG